MGSSSDSIMGISRREFIRRFSVGLPVAAAGGSIISGCSAGLSGSRSSQMNEISEIPRTSVTLVKGSDRRQMITDTLQPYKDEIANAIAGKKILIKINCNRPDDQLIKTHPDAVRGILDVISPMYDGKDPIMVGESTAYNVPTRENYDYFGYYKLEDEYRAKIVELNDDNVSWFWILDRDLYPVRIRIINSFVDPNVYVISVAPIKTHDTVIATLTLKNVVMGAPLRNPKNKNDSDKGKMHGYGRPGTPNFPGSPKLLNFNMFKVAHVARPDLCVLDGLVGAEGDGPNKCDPVDHRIALAGTDFVAVDRIGTELMGIPWEKMGYLQYCALGGLGQGDRDKISIIGENPKDHVKVYKLHSRVDWQEQWDVPIDWGLIHPRN
ncbi:DUF362 domain-containing protein [Candidatus Latescibacterota bacterium]